MTRRRAGRSLSATVIGGVAWNLLVDVPRLPTDLTTLHATGYRHGVGGTGAGKALHLARLGVDTRLHALIGDDEFGRDAGGALRAAGVEVSAWPDPCGTERHLNLLDRHGDRLTVILNRSSADPDVPADELFRLTTGADLVFVSLTEYSRRLLPRLTAAAVPVWVDLHDWDGGDEDLRRSFVDHGRYLFMSDVRLEDPLAVATRLAATRELVVVTHGSRGATAFFPDRPPLFIPAYDAGEVVDTNGAGDAFSVGVAYGLASGWDRFTSLRAGAVLAGGCVTARELADPALSAEWLAARL